ncbi:dipeptidase PepE [Marinifilum caeruleilacunae]|jgi:dipeptidase E|uniref:Dipeptidase PepE n=1 Tax=Marinifilum caeruleilacunae TaxID=2499076 RepID=A0ABX1WUR7_9BACT|nr:dipeptidase PepE [Marinifilum caeruleilacunae]NOU59848.1 dipeptidase PepE [Marinifilum caeruleilacunae]
MRLLLISNSTNPGEEYLDYPKHNIKEFLGEKPVKALFIPYAGVTVSFDDYEAKVKERFNEVGHDVVSIHRFENPVKAVEEAEAIVVGGGSTWNLLHLIHKYNLTEPIRNKVINEKAPYIGWSAGSNLTCPTIKTTNDMPIIDPMGFDALNLIPFQINPHYLDKNPEGHGGETREDRINEFMVLNPDVYIAGLREATMFLVEDNKIKLIGDRQCRIFKNGIETYELSANDDFNFLLK